MTPEQMQTFKKLAAERKYGRGPWHAKQVGKLSLDIYEEFVRLGMLKKADEDKQVLDAASLLHDIGLPKEPHNEVAFDEVLKYLGVSKAEEFSTLLYCILWHRGGMFVKRDNVDIISPTYTKKMAAILRVADALDRTLRQLVKSVSLRSDGQHLMFRLSSENPITTEISRAKEKADLMKEAYSLTEVSFEHAKR